MSVLTDLAKMEGLVKTSSMALNVDVQTDTREELATEVGLSVLSGLASPQFTLTGKLKESVARYLRF